MSRLNTWWVEFIARYLMWDEEEQKWVYEKEIIAERFKCLKKDIKSMVTKRVVEELKGIRHKNLSINITDSYITTDYEV